jgi:MYXO-CTERM domain-containing protein
MKWRSVSTSIAAVAAATALGLTASPAPACGGFFCSQAQPVNQAAERIVFSQNGDGTVTAVIQILYEGPSENFSWLLPITTVPEGDDIAVASDLAFTRLQAATNPSYVLNTRIDGQCRPSQNLPRSGSAGPTVADGAEANNDPGSGVVVAASGIVGSFEWTALQLDPMLDDPAASAIEWLTDNGYDVAPGADGLLRPYLAEGMYLLALRLTKGSSSGSIRPIVLTYDAELPMIPIKLTAVAANDDMGVMTWMLSDARAVPMNYNALELNEARINWFNASINYNDVVTAAADDAGGQGFVTEFAGASAQLGEVVWSTSEEQAWQQIRSNQYSSFDDIFSTLFNGYAGFDGFWDAMRATVTLPDGVIFEDFQACPTCYGGQVQFSPSALFQAVDDSVIAPMRIVQDLLNRRPYVTRLYSTLSAADMTLDPVFTMNADLPAVSNVHTADRVIECSARFYDWEAPWRIELPQGSVIRGTAQDVGIWPAAADSQPPNLRIVQLSESGEGAELENNKSVIDAQLATYNEQVLRGLPMADRESPMPMPMPGGGALPGSDMDIMGNVRDSSGGGGCAVGGADPTPSGSGWWGLGLLVGWVMRRRSQRGERTSSPGR